MGKKRNEGREPWIRWSRHRIGWSRRRIGWSRRRTDMSVSGEEGSLCLSDEWDAEKVYAECKRWVEGGIDPAGALLLRLPVWIDPSV